MHNYNEIRKRNPRFVIAGVVAAVMLLSTTGLSIIATIDNVFANSRSQAMSQVNDCGNGELPLNVGCLNIASEIQGDKNTVSQTANQRFPSGESPIPPRDTATLIVKKLVECPSGFVCPGSNEFEFSFIIGGAEAIPNSFRGSSAGTEITFVFFEEGEAEYTLVEGNPMTPPGLELNVVRSEGCGGEIFPDETLECTIRNIYREIP